MATLNAVTCLGFSVPVVSEPRVNESEGEMNERERRAQRAGIFFVSVTRNERVASAANAENIASVTRME